MSANALTANNLLNIAKTELHIPLEAARCLVFGNNAENGLLIEYLSSDAALCAAEENEQALLKTEKTFDLIFLFLPIDENVLKKIASFGALVVNAAQGGDWMVRDLSAPYRTVRIMALTQRGAKPKSDQSTAGI